MQTAEQKQRLEEEFQRFIELSNVLDRTTRKYLVWYLKNQLDPGLYDIPELNDQYYRYFRRALDEVFGIEGFMDLLEKNDTLSTQIMLDILYWLRKTWQKVRTKNIYQEEKDRLENFAVTPSRIFIKRWPALINYVQKIYTQDQFDTRFYTERLQSLVQQKAWEDLSAEVQEKLELIIHDLLAQWDALLSAKTLEYQLTKFEDEGQQFQSMLASKVEEYNKLTSLIAPFAEYVGRYWDMSRELWEETSFDILKKYQDLLEDEKSIKELADLLGKMREAEIEIEEETFEKIIIRQEWVVDPLLKTEIVGVHESNDLNQLVSSEASLLSDPDTELLFLKRYADKNLLTFRYEDQKLVKSQNVQSEIHQRVREKEKGPFIICVDTSESMFGRPEQIAKVLCLGILKMAARENRRAYLINFSTGIETLDLFDIANSINEIAKFLRMSFYGGTDISLPLYEAIRQLKSQQYEDADVLVISDFIMYQIDEDVLRDVRYFQHNKGTQFHSLTLSDDPNTKILQTFDNNWLYDPEHKGIVKDLSKSVIQVAQR